MEIIKYYDNSVKLTLNEDFILLTESQFDPEDKVIKENDLGFDDLICKEIAFDLDIKDLLKIMTHCYEVFEKYGMLDNLFSNLYNNKYLKEIEELKAEIKKLKENLS